MAVAVMLGVDPGFRGEALAGRGQVSHRREQRRRGRHRQSELLGGDEQLQGEVSAGRLSRDDDLLRPSLAL
jgi:hypothetical protein